MCNDEYLKALQYLKEKLVVAPIIIESNRSKPFELICNASKFVLGVVLGQQNKKLFNLIYYESKAFNGAQKNYSIMVQEFLAVAYAYKKIQGIFFGN